MLCACDGADLQLGAVVHIVCKGSTGAQVVVGNAIAIITHKVGIQHHDLLVQQAGNVCTGCAISNHTAASTSGAQKCQSAFYCTGGNSPSLIPSWESGHI